MTISKDLEKQQALLAKLNKLPPSAARDSHIEMCVKYIKDLEELLALANKPKLELVDKLSAKWVCVSDRNPKLPYNTLLFKGGATEPTKYAWYNIKTKTWLDVYNNKPITVWENTCWLDYGHSDYPDTKF